MADTPQNSETAAREALHDMLAGWKYIRRHYGDLYGVGWNRAQQKAEAALALRPASSPGEVTITDAMVEAALSAFVPGRGQVRSHLPRTKPGECASVTIMRAALTASLLSTTQTEADDGR